MEAQVQNAVEVALNPEAESSLKQQAIEFITQVRDSPDAWRLALALLTNQPTRPASVRHFALQILDSAIKRSFYNDVEAFQQTKTVLMGFLDPEPTNTQYIALHNEPHYLQNQVAHSLTLLFLLSYTTTWQAFFRDIIALIQKNVDRGVPFDPFPTRIFLRILSTIDEEVADALYTATKKGGDQHVNTEIKDRIRLYDVRTITQFLFQLMTAFQSNPDREDLVRHSLVVIGQWIAWIDITLIVNDDYISLIYRFLGHPGLRIAASETLANIVAKKMSSADKLELITFLNLSQVVGSLNANEDIEFGESMARLVNVQGLELTRIITDTSPSSDLGSKALRVIEDLLPLLLRFLSDEYDDTSMAVFPFLNELLSQSRRSAKKTRTELFDRGFSGALLEAIFKKLRYDDDTESPEADDSDEEAEFQVLRKRLMTFQESIGSLDPDLYSTSIHNMIMSAFHAFKSKSGMNWRDMEVALYELNAFAEPLKANGRWEGSPHLERFYEMFSQAITLASKSSNPLTRILFMEITVRYSTELLLRADLIPILLEFFVGPLGIHSTESQVQLRAWYLFERFLNKLLHQIAPTSTRLLSTQLLASFTDLLTIRINSAETTDENIDTDSDTESAHDLFFDSQLYLFQAAGLLIGSTQSSELEVGEALLESLTANICGYLQGANQDQSTILKIHHTIMAIGDIAKGLDGAVHVSVSARQQIGAHLFSTATEVILRTVEGLEDSSSIRDASRYAFTRLVNVMGENILDKIPRLTGGLLRKSSTSELIDFLPFLGHLIHKFKPGINHFLDELMLPLLARIFESLNQPVEGTDDMIQQTSMRKAYLSFILNLLNNRLESLFVSEANRSKFDAVLESIIHYAMDTSDATVEKVAFSVLNKMVVVWSAPAPKAAVAHTEPLDIGFQEGFGRFVIEHLSRVCFEVPSKSTFDSNDAQSRLVLAEIAGLQKSIFLMKGEVLCSYLQSNLFPSLGVTPAAAQEYVRALRQLDLKQFKKFFVNFASK